MNGRFKIVSVGWRCWDWWEQTLRSIESQSVDNYDVWIQYDGGDDAGELIQQWCDSHDERWNCKITETQQFAVRNQVEAIHALDPADDDIIVFLDLDGDQFAHRDVLKHLGGYYADDTLVTYGSYAAVPRVRTTTPASPFPPDVVVTNSYRAHMLAGGNCHFNHLRTMAGSIFKAIPDDQFFRSPNRWYDGGTDYIFMVCALELAGGRYKWIAEILCLYNHANPNADYRVHGREAGEATQHFLRRPPLQPLDVVSAELPPPLPRQPRGKDPYLPPRRRRQILREYGKDYGLRVFVETGTANGDTPAELMGDFDILYSIEVGLQLYKAALQRFAETNVVCFHGDSGKLLPKVLAKIDQPALFWLDGHFCGDARADKDTPIIEELEAIFVTGYDHVILIDDARLFEGMSHYGEHDWPHVDDVRRIAKVHGYDYEVADDIIRLTPP